MQMLAKERNFEQFSAAVLAYAASRSAIPLQLHIVDIGTE